MAIGRITGQMLSSTLNRDTTDLKIATSGESNLLVVDATNDRIGIGVASPTVQFETAGSALIGTDLTVTGNLTVNGSTTTINTTNLTVDDKNIELAHSLSGQAPSDAAADGGGIILKGDTDHTILWSNANDSWDFSEHLNVASGKAFRIADTNVLDANNLTLENIQIAGNVITSASNADISLQPSGTGKVIVEGIQIDGTVITGLDSTVISFGGNTLSGVGTPSGASDVATKGYVDSQVGSANTLTLGDDASNSASVNLNSGENLKFKSGNSMTLSVSGNTVTSALNDRITVDEIAAKDSSAVSIQSPTQLDSTLQVAGTSSLVGNTTIANDITLASGSITSASGTINFGNEILTTTGDVNANDINLSGNIDMTANASITIGSGDSTSDFIVNFDGTDAYITKSATSGETYIRSRNFSIQNNDGTQTFITGGHGGATELYHGGVAGPALTTTVSGGISIPNGTLLVNVIASGDSTSVRIDDGLGVDGSLDVGGTFTIANGQGITAILDEDNMASNSANALATQQSIKAYVDAVAGGTITLGDSASNAGSVNINSGQDLEFRSGDSITMTVAGNGVTTALNDNIAVNQIGAKDSSAVSITSNTQVDGTLQVSGTSALVGNVTMSGTFSAATGSSVGNLTLADGSITDSSGTISFNDENLTTTGTITAGNIQVDNLTVSGTTTSVNSTNITVSDPLLILSETNSGGADVDSGIMIERGSAGNNAVFYWNEGDDRFKAVLSTSTGSATNISDDAYATINAGGLVFGSESVVVSSILDEDAFGSDSATALATQQSIKAYVDAQDANIASDSLVFTNKTFDANGTGNSISNLEVADFAGTAIVTEGEGLASSDNDTSIPTTAAVIDYVSANAGGTLNLGDSASNAGAVSLSGDQALELRSGDSITLTVAGNGVTAALNDNITVNQIGAKDSSAVSITSATQIDGTLQVSGASTLVGNVSSSGSITAGTSFIIGGADLNETDLEKLDGITDGTAAANKALVLDGSSNIAGINSLTATTGDFQTVKVNTIESDDSTAVTVNDGLQVNGNFGFNEGVTVTQILDEDNFASDSATALATQQSIKAYVDAVAEGLHVHAPAKAATTDSLTTLTSDTVTYDNGSSGVGATLTLSTALTTLDGYTLQNGDRIIVKDESNQAHNGVYTWATGGTVLTRATDMDTPAEAAGGDFMFVQEGTLFGDAGFVQTETVTTIGSDNFIFVQFSGAGQIVAGAGLAKSGNELSVNVDDSTIEINADTLRVKDAGITNAKLATSTITLVGDDSTGTAVSLGETFKIAGGDSLNSTVSADTLTLNLDDNITVNQIGAKDSTAVSITSPLQATSIQTSGNVDVNGSATIGSVQIAGNVITSTDSTQLNFGQMQLTDVADPTQASDVATKSYVDSQTSSITNLSFSDSASNTGTVAVGTNDLEFRTGDSITPTVAGTGVTFNLNDNITVNQIGAKDSSAVSITSATQIDGTLQVSGASTLVGNVTMSGTFSAATGSTVGNLTLADGSITDSSGTISFNDENLTTSGTITAGNIQVDNLTVSGTTTSVNSTNITVSDPLIILSETNSGGADVDSGILVERGSAGNNAAWYWNEGDDRWKAVLTTSVGTATSVTDSSYATVNIGGLVFGSESVVVSSILDEDAFGSDSATALATQQSIKAYVDAQDANIASDTLTFTNKTFDANGTGNSITNLEVADFAGTAIVTEGEGLASSDNDTSIPTVAAVIDYVAANAGGTITLGDSASNAGSVNLAGDQDLEFRSGDSITLTVAGNGVTAALNDNITVNQIGAKDSTAVSITSPLQTSTIQSSGNIVVNGGTVSAGSGSSFGDVSIGDGSITSTSGTIDFGDENLDTTGNITATGGTITANQFDVGTLSITDGQITDTDGTIGFNNINLDGIDQLTTLSIVTNIISSSNSTAVVINDGLNVDGALDVGTNFTISNGISVNAILDEDTMSSDSATALATQQSIKAYVDTQISASSVASLNDIGDVDSASKQDGDILVVNDDSSNVFTVSSQMVTGMRLPAGTTAQRPPIYSGVIRYNTETGLYEGSTDGSTWNSFAMAGSAETLTKDVFTGDGGATYNFSNISDPTAGNGNNGALGLIVYIDNILQEPTQNYTISPTAITFDSAVHSGARIVVIQGFDGGAGGAGGGAGFTTITNSDVDSAVEDIDTWAVTTYRAAHYHYVIENDDTSEYQTGQLHVLHDGSNAQITEFGITRTGNNDLITFSVDINASNFRLRGSAQAPNSKIKLKRVHLEVQ